MAKAEGPARVALTAEQWAAFEAEPERSHRSIYQDDLDSAKVGEMFAIPLPTKAQLEDGARSERSIVSQLHKAARTAGKGIHVMVRRNANPPAVVYRIVAGEYVAPVKRERKVKATEETSTVE